MREGEDFLDKRSGGDRWSIGRVEEVMVEVDAHLRGQVLTLLEELTATGSPAMQARGKKLLRKLGASLEEVG